MAERKGLRFEVATTPILGSTSPSGGVAIHHLWQWTLIGADGPVCKSAITWDTEAEARASLAKNKGRLKAAQYAKVVTVDGD